MIPPMITPHGRVIGENKMIRYAWKIDKDIIDRNHHKDLIGPRGTSGNLENDINSGKGEKFRMFDDDMNLYYEGRITGGYDGFEPLDDFGQPNAGCTSIEYLKNGKWEQL